MHILRSILLVVAAAGAAHADPEATTTSSTEAPKAWSIGVEPRIGVLVPTSKLGTFMMAGVEVDKAFGRLVISLDGDWSRPSYNASAMDPRIEPPTATYTIHQTEVLVAALASYRFGDADAKLVPHLGAGPVLHWLKTNETSSAAPGENTEAQLKVGVELDGGLDFRAGPGYLAGDLRVVYSGLDTALTGSSNAGSVSLAAGYRLVF